MPYSESHLTPQEANAILVAHLPEPPTELPVVRPLESTDPDPATRARFQTYLVYCASESKPTPSPYDYYLITLQLSEPLQGEGETAFSAPNSLRAQYALQSALHAHLAVSSAGPTTVSSSSSWQLPFPVPMALNVETSRPYILARLAVSLTRPSAPLRPLATVRDSLPPERVALLELHLGVALRTLHNLQSEWCGPPALESEGLYSWQEAFTLLVEESLSAAESAGMRQRTMSRRCGAISDERSVRFCSTMLRYPRSSPLPPPPSLFSSRMLMANRNWHCSSRPLPISCTEIRSSSVHSHTPRHRQRPFLRVMGHRHPSSFPVSARSVCGTTCIWGSWYYWARREWAVTRTWIGQCNW
ncbi:hypothetical protein BGW80DRAFT_101727 [Lactifluus volemus]|nr:hypothetical protein BGW80DRAFT_101727 [Lactifluus volemus]